MIAHHSLRIQSIWASKLPLIHRMDSSPDSFISQVTVQAWGALGQEGEMRNFLPAYLLQLWGVQIEEGRVSINDFKISAIASRRIWQRRSCSGETSENFHILNVFDSYETYSKLLGTHHFDKQVYVDYISVVKVRDSQVYSRAELVGLVLSLSLSTTLRNVAYIAAHTKVLVPETGMDEMAIIWD